MVFLWFSYGGSSKNQGVTQPLPPAQLVGNSMGPRVVVDPLGRRKNGPFFGSNRGVRQRWEHGAFLDENGGFNGKTIGKP